MGIKETGTVKNIQSTYISLTAMISLVSRITRKMIGIRTIYLRGTRVHSSRENIPFNPSSTGEEFVSEIKMEKKRKPIKPRKKLKIESMFPHPSQGRWIRTWGQIWE